MQQGGIYLNQSDMIQRIIAVERQANMLTESVKAEKDNIEATIQAEIEQLRNNYLENAENYLSRLENTENSKREARLKELDERRDEKLCQVEVIYSAKKEEWVQTIFDRIVGKAGD